MTQVVDSQERPTETGAVPYGWASLRALVVQHHGTTLLTAQLLAVLATLANIVIPLLFPIIVDEVLLAKPGRAVAAMDALLPMSWETALGYILLVLVATLALRLIAMTLNVILSRSFTRVSKDIIHRIRCGLLARLQHISMAEFERLSSGSVTSRFATDLQTLDQFIGTTVSRLMIAVLTVVGVASILLWMHWKLALVIIVFNPVVVYLTTVLGRKVKALKQRENSAIEAFHDKLTEVLDGIHELRANNHEGRYFRSLGGLADEVKAHGIAFKWKTDTVARLSFLVFMFGFDVFRALSMIMVVFSGLTIGEMLAVFSYLWFVMTPVQELLGMRYSYFAADAALQRINRLYECETEKRYPRLENPFTQGDTVGIRMVELECSYNDGSPILDHVNLEFAPAEKVALIGASGGGKTTLIQVLLGLYPPTSGMVYYGTTPITRIGLDVVREHVTAVLQHPALFNDSVRANLTLGRDFSDEDLWQALEIAQLREKVSELEQGLDTVIGRRGARFSGGQRQRLAIARMVLADPKVVILDEATSAVDIETEERIFSALDRQLGDRTTVIISHRLSVLRRVDRIYVFENGAVVEGGHHRTMIQGDGPYGQLFGKVVTTPEEAASGSAERS